MGLNAVAVLVGVALAGVICSVTSLPTPLKKVFQVQDSSSAVIPPFKLKPRVAIPSSFAKSYWVSGTFFNNANFKGLPMSFYFTGPKCINFPSTKKSVKPTGCVMLYKEKNCVGPYLMANDDMAELGMGQINSMKTCPPLDDSWRSQPQSEEIVPKTEAPESVLDTPEQKKEEESRVEYRTIDLARYRPLVASRYF